MNKFLSLVIFACIVAIPIYSQSVTIQVDASAGKKPISPFIYGKNNCLSDNPGDPLTTTEWQFLRDAGVKMLRENGGNNCTKYNWRSKLSSHPDWYNNVYAHDWDFAAKSMQDNLPGVHGMWAFQLLGKVASNTNNNFNDWGYNQSQWWSGVHQNLAGGGVVNSAGGSKATTDGNPSLYLKDWPADSTVAILDKWFGTNGLKLSKNTISYWSMDNECEIWNGTHDDVMPAQLSADAFMQLYFNVAKKARAKFPDIKLVGPVPANEWQWYSWNNSTISYNGTKYLWLEYFIKRIADEQKASGTRLLDVLDIHFYPATTNSSEIVQLHRVFFDKNYVFPGANGVKLIGGGWDPTQDKEYIFERCRTWLDKHLGTSHGVTLSISEIGIEGSNPNVTAVWYASTIGTFANEGVEIFTPWTWKTGMWETLHLFSRYGKSTRVQSSSSLEEYVSAYSSVNSSLDSLTVILVNRSLSQAQSTTVNLSNFSVANGSYQTLTLSNLPSNETFQSHTVNALKTGNVQVTNGAFTASLAPLSVTAVLLKGSASPTAVRGAEKEKNSSELSVSIQADVIDITYTLTKTSAVQLEIFDLQGKQFEMLEKANKPAGSYSVQTGSTSWSNGSYVVQLKTGTDVLQKKFVIIK